MTNSISHRGDRRSITKSLEMSSEESRRKKLRSKDKAQKDKEIEKEPIDLYCQIYRFFVLFLYSCFFVYAH